MSLLQQSYEMEYFEYTLHFYATSIRPKLRGLILLSFTSNFYEHGALAKLRIGTLLRIEKPSRSKIRYYRVLVRFFLGDIKISIYFSILRAFILFSKTLNFWEGVTSRAEKKSASASKKVKFYLFFYSTCKFC